MVSVKNKKTKSANIFLIFLAILLNPIFIFLIIDFSYNGNPTTRSLYYFITKLSLPIFFIADLFVILTGLKQSAKKGHSKERLAFIFLLACLILTSIAIFALEYLKLITLHSVSKGY
jgi:hypothetical protein